MQPVAWSSKFKIISKQNHRGYMKKSIVILAVLFLSFSVYSEEVGKVIAKVNKEVITAKDLEEYYKMLNYRLSGENGKPFSDGKLAKNEALDRLIEDKLILDEAKKENFEVPSYLIDNQINKIISAYPSRDEFENSLIERGLNITILKERVKGQFLMRQVMDKYVNYYISVSPQEVSQYYKEHQNELVSPQKYIIWIAKSEDKNLLVKITQVIKENGISEAEKEFGNVLVKMEAALTELKEGVFQTIQGLKEGDHVVKRIDNLNYFIYLEKIVPPRTLTLEEARDEIFPLIYNKRFKERFQEWIKELKEKAVITIYPQ
jgi:hypothetical protein